jgi:hypothetical protein
MQNSNWKQQRTNILINHASIHQKSNTPKTKKHFILKLDGFIRYSGFTKLKAIHISGAGDMHLSKIISRATSSHVCSINRKNTRIVWESNNNEWNDLDTKVLTENKLELIDIEDSIDFSKMKSKSRISYQKEKLNDKFHINFKKGDHLTSKSVEDKLVVLEKCLSVYNWTRLVPHIESISESDCADLPLYKPARIRYARYKNIKTFRNSYWNIEEIRANNNESLYKFENFRLTKARALLKAKKASNINCGAHIGVCVSLYIYVCSHV